MKNYLTTAALFAAGTASANAASLTFSTAESSFAGYGNFHGAVFTLSGTDANRFGVSGLAEGESLPESVNLDSISFKLNPSILSKYLPNDYSLYITDSSDTVLAISGSCGNGFTVASAGSTTITFSFGGVTIDTASTYYAYFASSARSSTITSGSKLTGTMASNADLVGLTTIGSAISTDPGICDVNTATQWGLLWGDDRSALKTVGTPTAAPKMTILVSTIPEPSAFGLLAGAGALALVASRRRRNKR